MWFRHWLLTHIFHIAFKTFHKYSLLMCVFCKIVLGVHVKILYQIMQAHCPLMHSQTKEQAKCLLLNNKKMENAAKKYSLSSEGRSRSYQSNTSCQLHANESQDGQSSTMVILLQSLTFREVLPSRREALCNNVAVQTFYYSFKSYIFIRIFAHMYSNVAFFGGAVGLQKCVHLPVFLSINLIFIPLNCAFNIDIDLNLTDIFYPTNIYIVYN